MKKKELTPALDALKTIKISAIGDKELRKTVLANHLVLLRESRKFDEDVADLRTAHLSAFDKTETARLYGRLPYVADPKERASILERVNADKDYVAALGEFQEGVNALAEEDVAITPIDADAFVGAMMEQDIDLGQLEAIFPMFG